MDASVSVFVLDLHAFLGFDGLVQAVDHGGPPSGAR